jgi:hypothetical protein
MDEALPLLADQVARTATSGDERRADPARRHNARKKPRESLYTMHMSRKSLTQLVAEAAL